MGRKTEIKKALLIGVLGSFLLKIIEWSFQLTKFPEWINFLKQPAYFSKIILPFPIWFYQILMLVLFSSLITMAVYNFKKNLFHIAFVPSIWYSFKEIMNYFTHEIPFIFGLVEAIIIGLPVGISVYYVITREKIKIRPSPKKALALGLISTLWYIFVLWYAKEIAITNIIPYFLLVILLVSAISLTIFYLSKKISLVSTMPLVWSIILVIFFNMGIIHLLYGLLFGLPIGLSLYYMLGKEVIKIG